MNKIQIKSKLNAHFKGRPRYYEFTQTASIKNATNFISGHIKRSTRQYDETTALLDIGRLDYLLRNIRRELSWHFTELEIQVLVKSLNGVPLLPDETDFSLDSICKHFHISHITYRLSKFVPLIAKILKLSAAQKLALADAIEQAWTKKMYGDSAVEFIRSLGIEIAKGEDEVKRRAEEALNTIKPNPMYSPPFAYVNLGVQE